MPRAASAAAASPQRVTISTYARMRGAAWSTIKHHCLPGGMIQLVSKSGIENAADSDGGSATAKFRSLKARVELACHRLEIRQESYAERSEAVRVGILEAEHLLSGLAAVPDARAADLAARLSIDVAVAHELLERFVASCLTSIGDLRGQAIRAAEQA